MAVPENLFQPKKKRGPQGEKWTHDEVSRSLQHGDLEKYGGTLTIDDLEWRGNGDKVVLFPLAKTGAEGSDSHTKIVMGDVGAGFGFDYRRFAFKTRPAHLCNKGEDN